MPPSRAATPSPARAGSCPGAPGTSTGPAATVATLRLTVPPTGAGGATVSATATIAVRTDAARIVLQPAGSGLEVLQGAEVVGWVPGPGTSPVPLPLTAGSTLPAQVVPERLPLVACEGGALPAGRYIVRAVVGYSGDPLASGADGRVVDPVHGVSPARRTFHLVSEPVAITVT